MTITLKVHIKGNDGCRAMLHRDIELPFVPMPGMSIESSAWKDERMIKAVTVNIDEAPYDVQVYLGYDDAGSQEMYLEHGWKTQGT